MKVTHEDLETVLKALKPTYEPIKALAERVAMSVSTVGTLLAESRRRQWISTLEGDRGWYTHNIQNKGRAFLEWMEQGRRAGHLG